MNHIQVPHPTELKNDISGINSRMVNSMAKILGSVGFIWFCLGLDVIGFIALIQQTSQSLDSHQGLVLVLSLWVAFIAQSFIQLVALPVLQNYQNRQEAADAAKADADHMALTYLAQIQDEQIEILRRLDNKGPQAP